MSERARWICCHLGAREHYAVPRALHRRGELIALITDAWARPGSAWPLVPGATGRRLRERYSTDLASADVRDFTASLVAHEALWRVQGRRGWPLVVARNQWFQERAAAALMSMPVPAAIFAHRYAALAIFRAATASGLSPLLRQITPLQAHVGSAAERWKMLKAAGAIGTISIANPKTLEIPWARSTLARLQPQMSLADPALDEAAGQQLAVTMNPAHAEKLFAGSGHTFAEVLALADGGRPVRGFALTARIKASVRIERGDVESQNVAGLLRGSDPSRRDEYVVLSAHLDHLGVADPPINGDRVYNGAMDNASGVAAMLEVAARIHDAGTVPARSILFLGHRGRKGELGSRTLWRIPRSTRHWSPTSTSTCCRLPLRTLMVLGLDELTSLTSAGRPGARPEVQVT